MLIRRVSPNDLVELVTDVGPVPMNVGAALVVDTHGADVTTVVARVASALGSVPRLRQRLVTPPRHLGRPYWVEVATEAAEQVRAVVCPTPGDDDAFLALATRAVVRPLPRDAPLWRALVVPGLRDGRTGVVVVVHHVLTDGVGGLALLGLLGGTGAPAVPPGPAPSAVEPRRRDLALDVARATATRVARAPGAARELAGAVAELRSRPAGPTGDGTARAQRRAPRCSLTVPTGPRREVVVVRRRLSDVRQAGHGHAATVNDVLLVATTEALARVLAGRGEHPGHLVVSVPVSGRRSGTHEPLGNSVGVMPVGVPLTGTLTARLEEVARRTRRQKTQRRGTSASLVGPAFRLLAAVGVFRWFVDRQRLVNTFLSNMAGPAEPLRLAGATVEHVVPVTGTTGNVAVAFAALSYAGTLSVTVLVDPDVVPAGVVGAALEAALDAVLAPA